ncbi:hypothetical protein JYT99_01265 [bacterium AH-315-E09]|jgi:hypothetical protein|nr:hypothetical protein [bacterium AH-315-L21]MBN4063102.1 hypothetical protein [Alkaliphilus sp. AH-315-G20]MBN4067876.1 hypothetical protein [Alkaliphilus transvaalensis]MBN4069874.1 hypothetical protein [bacterium AH-315-G05]MBN4074537.1 hypothetical protein [bacterium AH-315-E09]
MPEGPSIWHKINCEISRQCRYEVAENNEDMIACELETSSYLGKEHIVELRDVRRCSNNGGKGNEEAIQLNRQDI